MLKTERWLSLCQLSVLSLGGIQKDEICEIFYTCYWVLWNHKGKPLTLNERRMGQKYFTEKSPEGEGWVRGEDEIGEILSGKGKKHK